MKPTHFRAKPIFVVAFSESSHRKLTHTTTLAAFAALAWHVYVRLCEAPRLQWYLVLVGECR